MARINVVDMEKVEKVRNLVQEEVEATYSVFDKDNKKYIQIDTYGREGRLFPGKVSQVIQLDKENAQELIVLLKKVFDI